MDSPEDFESTLSAEANRLKLVLPEYILRLLMTARPANNTPVTGAELVTYWQNEGVIGTRSDIADSSKYAHELRRRTERRVRR